MFFYYHYSGRVLWVSPLTFSVFQNIPSFSCSVTPPKLTSLSSEDLSLTYYFSPHSFREREEPEDEGISQQ